MLTELLLLCVFVAPTLAVNANSSTAELLASVSLPAGFAMRVRAAGMNQPRSLARSPNGNVYVGSLGDSVYALRAGDAQPITLLDKLTAPNGVAYDAASDSLFVAELSNLYVVKGVDAALAAGRAVNATLVADDFFDASKIVPLAEWHGNRYLAIHDGRLYMAIGYV